MYGTVARMRVKAGMLDALRELSESYDTSVRPPGYVAQYVYQMDDDPQELYLAVMFESREAYVANADSPEQHERFLKMREMLDGDPEWNDGVIIFPAG